MYSIAICDDIAEQITVLRTAVEQVLDNQTVHIETYTSVRELLCAQASGKNCDIVFLDVCMPEQNGICAAQQINQISPATQIIFISAHPDYALDAYDAEHIYFLSKPVQPNRLHAALLRAMERLNLHRSATVVLPLKGGAQHVLRVHEIFYFERHSRMTNIILKNRVLETALKLSACESLLPPASFCRPHNSYLVNLTHVCSATRTNLLMSNGNTLPISRQWRAAFLQALTRSM